VCASAERAVVVFATGRLTPKAPQTSGFVAAQPGRRTTHWIADATEVDYDLFRGPARSWRVAVSVTTSFRSSPEIVPSVVDGQHWMLEAVSGSTL
jgi:hypothetical protein